MKKTDYKSIFDYSGSVRAFVHDELLPQLGLFTIEVINLIPKGSGWQKELIFEQDFTLIENNQKNFCVLNEEKYKLIGIKGRQTSYPEIDLGLLDLAGMLNLLQKRMLQPKERDELTKVFYIIQGLRNTWSHESVIYNEKNAVEKTNNALARLKPILNTACKILIKTYKTDSNMTWNVFNDFQAYIEKNSKDFSVKVSRNIKESDSNAITPRLLCNYNIFVDETALRSKYDSRYINTLITHYNFNPIVCKQTVNYFKDCYRNNTPNKNEAYYFLNDVLDVFKGYKFLNEKNEFAVDSAEEIVWYIKDALSDESLKDKLFCVITEKKSLAKELWALNNNDSLIVIHAKSKNIAELFCYPGKESTEALEKPADNPKMELVFENAATVSSSFGNSSAEEIESVDNLNLLENRNSKNKINHSETVSINTSENKSTTNSIESKNELLPEVGAGDTIILDRGRFKNKKYKLAKELYAGGEGTIYEIEDVGTYVIKMYHKPPSEEQCNKLLAMVDTYADDISNKFFKDTCCWPKGIVYDLHHDNILGYAMEFKKNAVTLDRFLNKIQNDDSIDGYTRKDLVELCVKICRGFIAMNKICNGKVLMGDINLKNIMVTEDKNDIIFIDADSYQFKDYLCPVGTSDFTSPRLIKIFKTKGKNYSNTPRNKYDENFAIAVLIFSILFIKEFPFSSKDNRASVDECIVKGFYSYAIKKDDSKNSRRNYIYKNLTKEIKEVFNEIFKEQKHSFGATNWIEPLQNLKSAIISGKSSDEIFPTCYLSEKEDDCFEEEICGGCNKKFLTAKSTKENTQNDSSTEKKIKVLCPDCLTKKALAQTKIVRVSCSCCGASFTTNEWDYDLLKEMSSNKNEFECPDCNPAVFYSKKRDFIVRGNNLEETQNFEKKLIENMSYAFKHLQEKMP